MMLQPWLACSISGDSFALKTHHAKHVLLAFFCTERIRTITRFYATDCESWLSMVFCLLFASRVGRSRGVNLMIPGADRLMRRVMERLSRYAIAPMVLQQAVTHGYLDHQGTDYYFLLPDLQSLHSFAAEYQDARTFFLALDKYGFFRTYP